MDIWILQGDELDRLRRMLDGSPRGWPVTILRIAVDGDELKFKANEGTWSPGLALREAAVDPATQAALDSAARLGIRAKLTADEGLSAARQELIAAERKVDAAVRAKVADRVRQTYPTAHTLVAEGEWNEDGLLHLHVKKVLDAEGTMLDGYDEDGVSLSVNFDDLTNEIDALLDEIAERDDGYQGTHEFDVKDPTTTSQ